MLRLWISLEVKEIVKLENLHKKPLKKILLNETVGKRKLKVGDKMETFYRAQRGELLTIFPTLDSTKNNKWISIYDEESVKSLVGTLETKGQSLDLTNYSYVKLLSQYFIFLRKGDYSSADGMLSLIDQIQRKYTPEGFLPSPSKIDLEILQ